MYVHSSGLGLRRGPTRGGRDKSGKTTFARDCLGEYCQYLYQGEPLFRTVGNESTFYGPPTPNQLRRYLNQIPEDFEMCCKVWEELTIPVYAKHARYGINAGKPNKRFLDAQAFSELVLQPYREANFGSHAGPFIFEFQRHGLPASVGDDSPTASPGLGAGGPKQPPTDV